MAAFEVTLKRSGVQFSDDEEEAIRLAIEDLIDAWNDGYDINEMFEIIATECGEEPCIPGTE
jgi:hypothetical protein